MKYEINMNGKRNRNKMNMVDVCYRSIVGILYNQK